MEHGYIYINNNILPSLLAISEEEQAHGLMYQEWPPPVMSFLYNTARVNRFWMKNTPSPLDIVFCHDGKVSEICYGEPHSTMVIGSQLSDLVIELPRGTADSMGLKVGQSVGLVKPTIEELHKIIAAKSGLFVKI
jgi:uncharacterized membrane protein (UPF0127 family)